MSPLQKKKNYDPFIYLRQNQMNIEQSGPTQVKCKLQMFDIFLKVIWKCNIYDNTWRIAATIPKISMGVIAVLPTTIALTVMTAIKSLFLAFLMKIIVKEQNMNKYVVPITKDTH